jgi:hypothetical protein
MNKKILIVILLLITQINPVSATEESVRFIIQEVTPNMVEPGYSGPINITIRNVGFDPGYRVNGELTGISTPLNFIDGTKQFLDLRTQPCGDIRICNFLGVGDLATFSFDLNVPDDAETGVYYTNLHVKWEIGTQDRTTDLNFGVKVEGAPDLIISGTSTSPSVVYPDTEFSMPITVQNIGTESARSVKLSLTLGEGFSGENTAFLGTIDTIENIQLQLAAVNQTNFSPFTAIFNLKAEEEIELGNHNLIGLLEYSDITGREYEKSVPIDVFIQDRGETKLSISGINTSPSKIYPNTDFTLTLTLENTGSQEAKATKLDLSLPKEFTGEDSTFLGTISEDQTSSASLDMKAIKSSSPGVYTIQAKSSYTDEQGREKTAEETFNVFILDRGEVILEISGKSTSPTQLMPGTDFTLSVQLENIGEQDAKSVRMELETNGDLIGERSSFVGEIEKDDVATGVFDLKVEPTALAGQRMVSARVIYIDEQGVENTVLKSFDIFIGEPASTSRTTMVIVAVVVIGLVIYFWRRRKSEFTEA